MNDRKERIPWFEPEFGEGERESVLAVLDSNFVNDGEVTQAFESRVASFVGAKHGLAVSNGTSAIALALMGLGVGPGDEVIVPDFTFIATANAVRLAGADVTLVDIEPHRFTIDMERLDDAVGTKTRAVVAVDINGRSANYEELVPFCHEKGLALVCDAAGSLGSKHGGQYLGTFGDAGCYSFSSPKAISSGQGGMIVTGDTNLFLRLRQLKDQGRQERGSGGDDEHPAIGFNFKYTNLQAAIAMAQMDRLEARLAHFNERNLWYHKFFDGCEGLIFPGLPSRNGEVLLWRDALIEDREKVERYSRLRELASEISGAPSTSKHPTERKTPIFPMPLRSPGKGCGCLLPFTLRKGKLKKSRNTLAWLFRERGNGKFVCERNCPARYRHPRFK